ncbi:hypothetical protein ATO6_03895 [Oceanicola sp. 22II-s10i]|uniref:hypothetical protein n=1 Tax=Oceanicola sp. 22II-s10i TaxID=1317116 RepID=UPI000B525FDF|nr:hypothetical protein [Oceanicola sp. 22II-s10i]OWU86020.1 hypothetical protein ATO6_03895 [Oceanicola sp. 22II-s10i]
MKDPTVEMAISYYRVRQVLGGLGIALPFLLLAAGLVEDARILPSMSDYYHSLQRDIFVGCLFAIGMFLIAYKGHGPEGAERVSDDFVTSLAGFAALAVALFPNESQTGDIITVTQAAVGLKVAVGAHYLAAQVFLFSLAYMCLVKFARTASPARRRIYRACGVAIIGAGLLATLSAYLRARGGEAAQAFVQDNAIVFWCEAGGVWAFGIAWLTKGRAELLLSRKYRTRAGAA